MASTPTYDTVLFCISYVEPTAMENDDLAVLNLIFRHRVRPRRRVPVPLRPSSSDHRATCLAEFPFLYAITLRVHDVHRIAVRRQSVRSVQLVSSTTMAG